MREKLPTDRAAEGCILGCLALLVGFVLSAGLAIVVGLWRWALG